MVKFNRADFLDDQSWSSLWEGYLQCAEPFDPLGVYEISVIAQIPDQAGVLIFTDDKIYHSEESGIAVLQRFSMAHNFHDYELTSRVFKALGGFGRYKIHWVCPYFALFPLENTRHTTWINPLKIEMLHYHNGRYYAEMATKPHLALPILRRSVITRAEIASYGLALVSRDIFRFRKKSDTPLSFLDLPNTSFTRLLATRPRLAQFDHRIGEFSHHYRKVDFLHQYEQLEGEPRRIDWSE